MSWFSSKIDTSFPADAPNFHPVTTLNKGFGKLTEQDTAWACSTDKGFVTETQTWYTILEDGSMLMVQVIFSFVGVRFVPAQTQMTFKLHNPKTNKTVWKSVNVSGFKATDNGLGCKSSDFEIHHTGSAVGSESETYDVNATLDKAIKIAVKFTRPAGAPGFKFGDGPQGGYSIFGKDVAEGKRDGIVVHRWHPIVESSGSVMLEGQVVDAKGDGVFIHAIQGMRPNLIASRWNFAFFTSGGGRTPSPLGTVRAVQMEFETIDEYGSKGPKSGRVKVNVGAVYTSANNGQPLIIVGEHQPADAYATKTGDVSRATHTSSEMDAEVGYPAPTGLKFEWEGDVVQGGGRAKAEVEVTTGLTAGQGGFIERVNVLAEIPYLVRKALSQFANIKPYIYQYHNSCTLNVTLPDGQKTAVDGWMFNEATFISE